MKERLNDFVEFLFKTIGGLIVLVLLIVLIFLALFWPNGKEQEPMPFLGVTCRDIDVRTAVQLGLPFDRAVIVDQVYSNSPADYANIAQGDFIIKFNEVPILSSAQLSDTLADLDAKDEVWLTVYRDGAYYNVLTRLAVRPDSSFPAQTVALAGPVQQPLSLGRTAGGNTPAAITPDSPLTHPYKGVCSNCHFVMSRQTGLPPKTTAAAGLTQGRAAVGFVDAGTQVNSNAMNYQNNSQLVAALRQMQNTTAPMAGGVVNQQQVPVQQLPAAGLPGANNMRPLEEFVWAGMGLETFNPVGAAALGLPPNTVGVVVDDVLRGSQAEKAGLLGGDLIQEVNGIKIYDVDSFAQTVTALRLTGGVVLVNRQGKSMLFTVPEA